MSIREKSMKKKLLKIEKMGFYIGVSGFQVQNKPDIQLKQA